MTKEAEIKSRPEPQDHKRSQKKKPVIRPVYICNDTEQADQYYELLEELSMLKIRFAMEDDNDRKNPSAADLEAKVRFDELVPLVADLEKGVRENALKFTFRSIGRTAFNKLVDAYQPTDKDRKEVEDGGGDPKNLRWSPRTFFPALTIAAADLVPDGVNMEEIWEDPDWNEAELALLSNAALEANEGRRIVPLGKG